MTWGFADLIERWFVAQPSLASLEAQVSGEGDTFPVAPGRGFGWMKWVIILAVIVGVCVWAWGRHKPLGSAAVKDSGVVRGRGPTTRFVGIHPVVTCNWVCGSNAGVVVDGVMYETFTGDRIGDLIVGRVGVYAVDLSWNGVGFSVRPASDFPRTGGVGGGTSALGQVNRGNGKGGNLPGASNGSSLRVGAGAD